MRVPRRRRWWSTGMEELMMGFRHGLRNVALLFVIVLQALPSADAAQPPSLDQQAALRTLSERLNLHFNQRRGALWSSLATATSGPQAALNNNPEYHLVGIDENGRPVVYHTLNLPSAITIRTNEIWPGGVSGYDTDGSGFGFGEMGMWDAGAVLASHQELVGRTESGDTALVISNHATHTAGTMIATGLRPSAKGMAYAGPLTVFEWDNDYAEMAEAAANGMLVSNHSYGPAVGWAYDLSEMFWYWFGDPTVAEDEDYLFGYYDEEAQAFDEIAYNAPDYVIVRAAGNDRLEGPPEGSEHFVFVDGAWELSNTPRIRDGAPYGYDAVSHGALAKNVISVGGVEQINGGYLYAQDVRIGSFSSYGPTDDGRIKPDLVAVGLFVESSSSTGVDAYRTSSGTSVAAPSVSGSIALLQELYRQTHGGINPRSATIRGLLAHTTEEAGPAPGPDYTYGWGLMNTRRAANVIMEDGRTRSLLFERTLQQGESDTIVVRTIGALPIRATLAWTDPAAVPLTPALDDTTPVLVNDLDLLVRHLSANSTYRPWVLYPAEPSDPATTGDNRVDNIEQVFSATPTEGLYHLIVSHKGELAGHSQEYSLCLSGLRVEEDLDFQSPRYASGSLNGETGQVDLSWAFGDQYPAGYGLLQYDDGEPEGTSPSVGTIMGTYFENNQSSIILEMHIWTAATRPNLRFDAFVYQTTNDQPRDNYYLQYTEMSADNGRWNILSLDPSLYDPLQGDFLVAFRCLEVGVGLGIDPEDNGHSWSRASGGWARVPTTYFIRTLVQHEDGSTEMIYPSGFDPQGLDELDEFVEFQIWRDTELLGVSDTIHYVDHLSEAGVYEYRITALHRDGSSIASNPVLVDWSGVDVNEREQREIPGEFRITRAWPNPFNAMVTAEVALPQATTLHAEVFDVLGRQVATLYEGQLTAGRHRITWQAETNPSGIYFLRVQDGAGRTALRKISLIR